MIYGPIEFSLYPIPGALCELMITCKGVQTTLIWPPHFTQAETLHWFWAWN